MKTKPKIVRKIEDDVDRREVAATTYQMRNPFKQFSDAVANELDTHCYFQHAFAADLVKKGDHVLDMCCGRGLLIPFLRYRLREPSRYVGVDIAPSNAKWTEGWDPRRETQQAKDWGFETVFVEASVADMIQPLTDAFLEPPQFDVVVYTSSIEHMQPEWQQASLQQAYEVTKPGGILYLSCPVTEYGTSGYDAQYPAHVYEPSLKELNTWLSKAGWKIKRRIGISTKLRHAQAKANEQQRSMIDFVRGRMPREQALPTIACLFPDLATEVALLCQRD